jgi:BirA family biotin operon repressor/biotin-[acetyl-CoA-carboxylase] ligase
VVVAELQTAGRGRADRTWQRRCAPGSPLSVLLRPAAPRETWGWLPLVAGLAVAGPVADLSGLELGLKWPNDVLVADRKLAGLLAEVVDDAVVLGIGLNVSLREDELRCRTATSLAVEGSEVVDREPVLRAVLRDLGRRYRSFESTAATPGRPACTTPTAQPVRRSAGPCG